MGNKSKDQTLKELESALDKADRRIDQLRYTFENTAKEKDAVCELGSKLQSLFRSIEEYRKAMWEAKKGREEWTYESP